MRFGTVGADGNYIETGVWVGMSGRWLVDIDGDKRFRTDCVLSERDIEGLVWYVRQYSRLVDDMRGLCGRAGVHEVVLDALYWVFDNVGFDASVLSRYCSFVVFYGESDDDFCDCLFSRFDCLADFFSSVPDAIASGCLKYDEIGKWFRTGLDEGLDDEAVGLRIVGRFNGGVSGFFRNMPVLAPACRFVDSEFLWSSYRNSLPRLRAVNECLYVELL